MYPVLITPRTRQRHRALTRVRPRPRQRPHPAREPRPGPYPAASRAQCPAGQKNGTWKHITSGPWKHTSGSASRAQHARKAEKHTTSRGRLLPLRHQGPNPANYGNPQCTRGHHQKGTRFTTRQLSKQSRHLDQPLCFPACAVVCCASTSENAPAHGSTKNAAGSTSVCFQSAKRAPGSTNVTVATGSFAAASHWGAKSS